MINGMGLAAIGAADLSAYGGFTRRLFGGLACLRRGLIN